MKKMLSLGLLLALTLFTATSEAQVYQDGAVNLNFTGRLNGAKAVDIPSNALVDLNAMAGNLVHVVGTTTITSFGTASQAGIIRNVIFDGALTLTHNASTLVIPGAANVTTAAGDSAVVAADSTTKWIVLHYKRRASAP